jgi:hypothetical protein
MEGGTTPGPIARGNPDAVDRMNDFTIAHVGHLAVPFSPCCVHDREVWEVAEPLNYLGDLPRCARRGAWEVVALEPRSHNGRAPVSEVDLFTVSRPRYD